jgi:hypothetical protein
MRAPALGKKAQPKMNRDLCNVSGDSFQPQDPSAGEGGRERPNKLRRLFEYLKDLEEEGFTGYIKINYSQGSIGRVERFQEVLKE